jgi:hypothetical protein
MWCCYSQYRMTNAVPDMTNAARATNSQSRFESSFIPPTVRPPQLAASFIRVLNSQETVPRVD